MGSVTEVLVPDIGDFADVDVIEVLVSPGDTVNAEDPLITLESDKATMDVPSPSAGVVREVRVGVGDKVSEGVPIVTLESAAAASSSEPAAAPASAPTPAAAVAPPASPAATVTAAQRVAVTVPDIGDFADVEVIEVHVGEGDTVAAEDPLITLESDKATMDVPSPAAGVVSQLQVRVGTKVSQGSAVLVLTPAGAEAPTAAAEPPVAAKPETPAAPASGQAEEAEPPGQAPEPPAPPPSLPPPVEKAGVAPAHASPGVRRFARELGADLAQIRGSGPKGRILKEDVQAYVKSRLAQEAAPAPPPGSGIPPMPEVDFSKFGDVELKPLPRIKRISGPHLHRAWLNVPHVTHFDEADITELEAFRSSLKQEAEEAGVRITVLAFVTKALAKTLAKYPHVNASLSQDGQNLVYKKYFHVGIAVDTPNGLVVPVIRDVDAKGVMALAAEMGELSARAREGKLKPDEMQGGCISISSLGGIGGTGFTPIVNAPEVAILGVTRARMTPVWDGSAFQPRLMLPVSLSYDHRVVDGAEAARFCAYLCRQLEDVRRLLL